MSHDHVQLWWQLLCSAHDVKLMRSKITVPRSRWETHCSKTCLSDALSTTVPYGTTFAFNSFSPEKSLKNIRVYMQAYMYTNMPYLHNLSPSAIDCWTVAADYWSRSPTIDQKRAQVIYAWYVWMYVHIYVGIYVFQ